MNREKKTAKNAMKIKPKKDMKPHLMTSARSRYELYTPKQKMELYKQSIGLGKQKKSGMGEYEVPPEKLVVGESYFVERNGEKNNEAIDRENWGSGRALGMVYLKTLPYNSLKMTGFNFNSTFSIDNFDENDNFAEFFDYTSGITFTRM